MASGNTKSCPADADRGVRAMLLGLRRRTPTGNAIATFTTMCDRLTQDALDCITRGAVDEAVTYTQAAGVCRQAVADLEGSTSPDPASLAQRASRALADIWSSRGGGVTQRSVEPAAAQHLFVSAPSSQPMEGLKCCGPGTTPKL